MADSRRSEPLSERRIWRYEVGDFDPLPILSRLSGDERLAVRWAFKRWVEAAQRDGYLPIRVWENFSNEVDHSALLNRLLGGKDALPESPSTEHSYPVYPD